MRYGVPWPTGLILGPKPDRYEEYQWDGTNNGYKGIAVTRTVLTLRCMGCGDVLCMQITGGGMAYRQNKRMVPRYRERGIRKIKLKEVTETYEKIMKKKAELNSN